MLTSDNLQRRLAVIENWHGTVLGESHTAPVTKLPLQFLLAIRAVEVIWKPQGQGNETGSPNNVSGHSTTKSRYVFPSGDGNLVDSGGQ